jgi:hypothetical protein
MDYFVTKRGNIINSDRVLIPKEEGNPLFEQYVDFLRNDGTVQETDLLSDEEIQQDKQEQIDALQLDWQEKIHQLIWLHLEKKKMREVTGEQYEVPQEIVDAYNTLRQEYNTLKNEILNS